MMKKMCRLIAELAMAIACAGMWGCGLFDEEVTTTVNEERSGGRVIAILDDSLAFVFSGRRWDEFSESCDYWNNCDYGFVNQGLFLVNYRKKQAPYWGDTINGVLYTASGLVYDSTIFVYDDDENFGFWKAGELPDFRKKMKWSGDCIESENIQGVRTWEKGKILLKMEWLENCPYAVLDTATGDVKKLEFTGELAWLEGCDDVTYIDGDVVCLKALYAENRYGVYKYASGELTDSLMWNDAYWSEYTKNVLEIRGNMFTIKHPTEMINHKPNVLNGTFVHSISPLETPELPIRIDAYTFTDSFGNSISYSSEDLIVTK